ncbi:unnamed protein product [Heligmosomoides polygyrus]|uniref:Folliculin n=1 Tax=Heligmosomoides polygyrus TaxID=6339 RepID=A0A183F933_HELPZ|nr:unnamed protein product [Heligmosomoides polygyrus]
MELMEHEHSETVFLPAIVPVHILRSVSAGFAEKTKSLLMTKDKLPLGKLGLAICQHDIPADYHTFISYKMGDVGPDVEEGKTQTLSSVQLLSDLIVRQLMNVIADQSNMIVGVTAAVRIISYCLYFLAEPQTKIFVGQVDSCIVRLTRIETELAGARSSVVKKCQEAKLPEDTCLAFENLTQVWRIPQLEVQEDGPDLSNALFKVGAPQLLPATLLTKTALPAQILVAECRFKQKDGEVDPDKRGKPGNHVTACTDFFPRIPKGGLRTSCPGEALRGAHLWLLCQACGPPRFPGTISGTTDRYWLSLGDTDEEREAAFEEWKKARAHWTILVRGALQRALYDIRKCALDANGRLVPAPKVKTIRVGPSRERANSLLNTTTKKTTPRGGKTN